MKSIYAAVLAVALSTIACDVPPIGDPNPPGLDCEEAPQVCVDPRFDGRWAATGSASTAGQPLWTGTVILSSNANEDRLGIHGVCPDGEGGISAVGTGTRIEWSGQVYCPAPTTGCPTAYLALVSGVAELKEADGFTLRLEGMRLGCDLRDDVVVEFTTTIRR
jgi:hypothetical protein